MLESHLPGANADFPHAAAPAVVENFTFDELTIGQSAERTHTLRMHDLLAFAAVSGDANPAHLDAEYAQGTVFEGVIAHGMWGGAFISALLGTQLPGPGTIYLEQSLRFCRPVRPGDTVTATLTVSAKEAAKRRVTLDCVVRNQRGEKVITGTALVMAPSQKVRRPRPHLPRVVLQD